MKPLGFTLRNLETLIHVKIVTISELVATVRLHLP
jgi:plasmid maintenance system antidote protein VapI